MAFVDYGSEDTKKEDGPDLQNQQWKIYYDVTADGKLHQKYKIKSPKNKKYPKEEGVPNPYQTHFKDKVTQIRMDRIVEPEAKFLSARRVSATLADNIVSKFLP